MDKAAIIGVGITKIEANKVKETFADMVWEAVNKALYRCKDDDRRYR